MASPPWAGSGTATTVAATVDVRNPMPGNECDAGALAIKNTGGSNNLLIAFDGATFATTVGPGQAFAVSKCTISSIAVKSNTSTTTYEWVAVDQRSN